LSFLEIEFPTQISLKAVGGPGFNTTVNKGLSGNEQRNRNWSKSRGKWTIDLNTPATGFTSRQQFVDLLYAFHLNVGGQADAFRFKDHKDFQAKSQPLVTVTGGVQLAITHTMGARSYVQLIYKPITAAINNYKGAALANTVFLAGTSTAVTVDATTGLVTGQSAGTSVDFQYHYPVRFDTDDLAMQLEALDSDHANPLVSLHSINLIEVFPPNY